VPDFDAVNHKLDLCGKISAGVDTGIEFQVRMPSQVGRCIAVTNDVGQSTAWVDGMAAAMKNSDSMPGDKQFVNQIAPLKARTAYDQYVHLCYLASGRRE